MRRTVVAVTVLATAAWGCGGSDPEPEPEPVEEPEAAEEPEPEPEPEPESTVDLAALESELDANLEGRDLALYVHGIEAGSGGRVRVLTQLTDDQTGEADAICNNTTAAALQSDVEVSGVDVAAAGGRNIAHCEPH